MKKNLLKILACSAVVAMVASCGNKTPSSSSSGDDSQSQGIEYRTVAMNQINAVNSDGSYSLEGEYVQFSAAAVSGGYDKVLYVNNTDVTYYSDLVGLEVHQKEAGEFEYKDLVSVKGKVASEDGRVFLDEAEVTLDENGKGAGSVYTWSNYFNRMYYQSQFNKTYSGFPLFGINLQLASLPDATKLAAGETTEFYVTFPGEDLDLEDLDNSCPFRVLIPGELADETFEDLQDYFELSEVGDVIELDAHMFYSQSAGGLGLVLDDKWFQIDDGAAVVLDEWDDVVEIAAEGLQVALPDIGVDEQEGFISYVPDDSYFHADINDFGAWQIAKIASADKKKFGAFETTVNLKVKNFDSVLAAIVANAEALGGNWVKDNVNTDAAKKQYAFDLMDGEAVKAVLTIEKASNSSLCVDFFAETFPWTAYSIIESVAVTMGATNKIAVKHVEYGRETSVYGGYYYSYDTIIDTLASQLLPDGAKESVKPHDISDEEANFKGYAATYTFEGFTIEIESEEIAGQSRPAAWITFSIWESTNITNADAAVVKAGYEERVNAFFDTDDFESAIPAVENVASIIFDYYYESYYEPRFETKGEFTDYEFTYVLAAELPEGVTAKTLADGLKDDLATAGFVEKTFYTTNKAGLFNEDTNEFVMVTDAKAEDKSFFVEVYNLSDAAVEAGLKVSAEFDNFAAAKAEYVARAESKIERLGSEFALTSALPELAGAQNYLVNWANEGKYDADYEEYGMTLVYGITASFADEANVAEIANGYLEALGTAGFEEKEFLQNLGYNNATSGEFVAVSVNTTAKTIALTIYVNDTKAAGDVKAVVQWTADAAVSYVVTNFLLNVTWEDENMTEGDVVYNYSGFVGSAPSTYLGYLINYRSIYAYGTWTFMGYSSAGGFVRFSAPGGIIIDVCVVTFYIDGEGNPCAADAEGATVYADYFQVEAYPAA